MPITYHSTPLWDVDLADQRILIPVLVSENKEWQGYDAEMAKRFPRAKQNWLESVPVLRNIELYCGEAIVANMCCIRGKNNLRRQLHYPSLCDCMNQVNFWIHLFSQVKEYGNKVDAIHADLHGLRGKSGTIGGNWPMIHELMEDLWSEHDVNVHYRPDDLYSSETDWFHSTIPGDNS